MPASAALFGEVVHAAVETIVTALVAAGCESTLAAGAVQVLRDLGGITAVAERTLTGLLARLDGNPRIDIERMRRLRTDLTSHLPAARVQIQAYLGRTNLSAGSGAGRKEEHQEATTKAPSPHAPRRPLGIGAHPELTLTAGSLRLTGRVDLLTVDNSSIRITDFKTGAEDPGHIDQLRMYALLWDLDRGANPRRRPATELVAVYPTHDVTIPAPTAEELRSLERTVDSRIAAADTEVAAEMPKAIPNAENCSLCQVRQLCGEYWEQVVKEPGAVSAGAWFDYEGVVGAQNGTRSWWMLHTLTGQRDLLLRTPSTVTQLTLGSRIRVLGLRLEDDLEVDSRVAAMTAISEMFVLADST
jgi:hypothetical protein